MCETCAQFCATELASARQLEDLLHLLFNSGVKPGVLVIEAGDLQRSDIMECRLSCTACGQHFQLNCETYHGSGGRFGPVESTG